MITSNLIIWISTIIISFVVSSIISSYIKFKNRKIPSGKSKLDKFKLHFEKLDTEIKLERRIASKKRIETIEYNRALNYMLALLAFKA